MFMIFGPEAQLAFFRGFFCILAGSVKKITFTLTGLGMENRQNFICAKQDA